MFLHLFLAATQIASAVGYCYSHNGTLLVDVAFQPCNNATKYSACCMTNHSGAGHVGIANDVCMDNGLCQNYAAYDTTNYGQQVWSRQGCTDQTWGSPYCLADVCDKPEYSANDGYGNAGVFNCGGEKWCCGDQSCCDDEKNIIKLAATVGLTSTMASSTPSPSISFSTSSRASSSTSMPSTSPPETSSSAKQDTTPGGLSTGAKAGIGIGVVVLVILAAAGALLLLRSRKLKDRRYGPADGSAPHTDVLQEQKYDTYAYAHELHTDNGVGQLSEGERVELSTNNAPQELEARRGRLY